MNRNVILDTGPLVALIDAGDRDHSWSERQWGEIQPPMLTCESVISEACFLLKQTVSGVAAVFQMLARKTIELPFRMDNQTKGVEALLRKYSDTPMSVADACLVRMAEQIPGSLVFTLDSDFKIYRKHGRLVIPLIAPDRVKF